MEAERTKQPGDSNQLVDMATGESPNDSPKHPRGRAGGLKGGPARARKLTSIQRRDIARVAAQARWKKS